MRKIVLTVCCLALLAPVALASSDKPALTEQDVPVFIKTGIRAYRDSGAQAAMTAWTHNSPIEGSKTALDQVSILVQANQMFGRFESYDVAGGINLSSRTRVIYLVLNYEKGPVFGRFVVYRSNEDWVLTDIGLSFHDDQIFSPLMQ